MMPKYKIGWTQWLKKISPLIPAIPAKPEVSNLTGTEYGTPCRLQFYKTLSGWRWRLRYGSGNPIAGASVDAYRKPSLCVNNFCFITGYSGLPESFRLREPMTLIIRLERTNGPQIT